jgi:polyisoprenoid-binding protein YceI
MIRAATFSALMLVASGASAEAVTYTIDPGHTYPAFEADHMGGLSLWRGKFNSSSGSVTLDRVAKTGEINVTIDMASVDFGHDKMNEHAKGADIFDVAKFPVATYKGKVSKWNGDAPTEVDGTLTMHGVTKPVKLTVGTFLCKPNPMNRRETCGADASATLNREEFGVDYGKNFGFNMSVKLLISIEAARSN